VQGVGWRGRTQRDVVVWLNGHALLHFDLVDGLEDGEAVAHAVQANLLELGMLDFDQHLARELVIYGAVSRAVAGTAMRAAYR
jgi:hypothetical protein